MAGKFMNIKRIVIPTLTMIIIASQLMGCSAVSQSELLKMINNGDQIEIEVATPISEEQGTEQSVTWEELALLTSNETLRKAWDDTLGITLTDTGKNGMLYVNAEGDNENNNTLRVALHNREFQKAITEEGNFTELAEASMNQYADIEADEETKALYMGINGYFNLLQDNTPNYSNPDSTLERSEFMAMVMRAETPVTEITPDKEFAAAVGNHDLNIYAQEVTEDSYLDLESKSLNNLTYNGTITRAEAVYMLMSRYYADELKTIETKGATLSDAKDGGDIATKQKFIEDGNQKDYWKSYELTYALQNPDQGLPTDLYKALVLAESKGIINSETRWDEALTKSEAMELLVTVYMDEDGIPEFNFKQGKVEMAVSTTPDTTESRPINEDVSMEEATEKQTSGMIELDEALAVIENLYERGIFTEEQYKQESESMRKLYEEKAEEQAQLDNSQGQTNTTPTEKPPGWVPSDPSKNTEIQYGQGDYSGFEDIRIN